MFKNLANNLHQKDWAIVINRLLSVFYVFFFTNKDKVLVFLTLTEAVSIFKREFTNDFELFTNRGTVYLQHTYSNRIMSMVFAWV